MDLKDPTAQQIADLAADILRAFSSHFSCDAYEQNIPAQHTIAQALVSTFPSINLVQFQGTLLIEGKEVDYPETLTLCNVKGRYIGPGKIYLNQEIREALYREARLDRDNQKSITDAGNPCLSMKYREKRAGNKPLRLGRTRRDILPHIEGYAQSILDLKQLDATTMHASPNRPSRRI